MQSATALTLLFGVSIANATLPPGMSVHIEPAKTEFAAADTVLLDVIYTNNTSAAIRLLKWNTALEGRINSDFLRVYFDGAPLEYTGRVYKRGTPAAGDFVNLQPGQSVSAMVDVSDGYDLISAGRYTVWYSRLQTIGVVPLSKQVSPTASFSLIEGRVSALFKRQPIFESCSASRQAILNSALSAAESIAITAKNALAATPIESRSAAQRYREWFGPATTSRWNTVQSHFNKIADATSNRTINFDCSCNDNFFAYVFPNQPYDIYLCSVFWAVPTTGSDSKAGTIIHELSHFNVIASTDDHVYGQSAARSLANNNPTQATANADNHEYFAENSPFKSMPSAVVPPDPDPDPDPEPVIPDPEPEPEPEPPTPIITPILELLVL